MIFWFIFFVYFWIYIYIIPTDYKNFIFINFFGYLFAHKKNNQIQSLKNLQADRFGCLLKRFHLEKSCVEFLCKFVTFNVNVLEKHTFMLAHICYVFS